MLSKVLRSVYDKRHAYIALGRYKQQTGTILVFIPFAWGTILASPFLSTSSLFHMSLFYWGCFHARSLGCAANDFWDKDFDKGVARTKERPVASNELSRPEAFTFAVAHFMAGSLIFPLYCKKL